MPIPLIDRLLKRKSKLAEEIGGVVQTGAPSPIPATVATSAKTTKRLINGYLQISEVAITT
jgi:hypothetical protein